MCSYPTQSGIEVGHCCSSLSIRKRRSSPSTGKLLPSLQTIDEIRREERGGVHFSADLTNFQVY